MVEKALKYILSEAAKRKIYLYSTDVEIDVQIEIGLSIEPNSTALFIAAT